MGPGWKEDTEHRQSFSPCFQRENTPPLHAEKSKRKEKDDRNRASLRKSFCPGSFSFPFLCAERWAGWWRLQAALGLVFPPFSFSWRKDKTKKHQPGGMGRNPRRFLSIPRRSVRKETSQGLFDLTSPVGPLTLGLFSPLLLRAVFLKEPLWLGRWKELAR